jgi:hypothetical protein
MKENNDSNAHCEKTRSEPRWSLSAVCRIYHLTYQQQPQSPSVHVIYPVALPELANLMLVSTEQLAHFASNCWATLSIPRSFPAVQRAFQAVVSQASSSS